MRFSCLGNHRQNMYLEMYLAARKRVTSEDAVYSAGGRPRKIPPRERTDFEARSQNWSIHRRLRTAAAKQTGVRSLRHPCEDEKLPRKKLRSGFGDREEVSSELIVCLSTENFPGKYSNTTALMQH